MNLRTSPGSQSGPGAQSYVLAGGSEQRVKSHCWYCNKPLYGFRTFCGPECREAMYEDNEVARQRRRILGCDC